MSYILNYNNYVGHTKLFHESGKSNLEKDNSVCVFFFA